MGRRGLVVAGFDGSEPSWTAVDHAATEAVLRGYDVRLVHSLLPAPAYEETALVRPVEDPATEARRLLDFARSYLYRQHGRLRVQVYIADRPAGELLLSEAHAADLVVVGRRGRGRLPVRLGSVSAQVARHATGPVAVVGGAPEHPAGPVVVGVDAAAPSEAAIGYAFDTADRHGSDLRACYVIPGRHPHPAGELLDRALAPWRERFPHVPVSTAAVPGADPAAALLRAAGDASLLVVGCRQQDGLRRLLAGSVSHTLVQQAAVPLLVAAGSTAPAPEPAWG